MTSTLRVVQTAEAFHYPKGKVWGPYKHLADALERVKLLRRHGADGKVQAGDWNLCFMTRPEVEWEVSEGADGDA